MPEEIQNDPVVLQAASNYLSIFGLTKPIKRNLTYGITKNVESIPSHWLRKGFDLDEFNMSKIFRRGVPFMLNLLTKISKCLVTLILAYQEHIMKINETLFKLR